MKSKVIAAALLTVTTAAVVLYPATQTIGAITLPAIDPPKIKAPVIPNPDQQARVEVVFVLDTTGSMSGLIRAAKEKIWSIASTMAQAENAPEIKMGLVAYRDRGDTYVTRVTDLSADLDSMYATLMDYQAGGGGDTPESVNQALYDAVHKMSWSKDQGVYKVVFLVGDAPAHMDYQDDVKYPITMKVAQDRGIVVNTIQSGSHHTTRAGWQRIASLGHGRYFHVNQSGDAVAIATPFDEKLAKLSAELDDTRLYYGDKDEKKRQQAKVKASKKLHARASVESRARRATFNASKSGRKNRLGENELVDAISSGRIGFGEIDKDHLPAAMQAMAPAEQKAVIRQKAEKRQRLEGEVKKLVKARSDYMKKKIEESGGASDSLDEKIYSAVREQAEKTGIRYKSDSAEY